MNQRDELEQAVSKAVYVEAHWTDTITEHDLDRKPKAEYERRAAEKWDEGKAGWSSYQRYPRLAAAATDAILAAGYRKARTITFEEAESLNDGAAILTPGQIIFRKYDGFFSEGVTGWIRDQWGQNDPLHTRSLDAQMHFPATVIHEGDSK